MTHWASTQLFMQMMSDNYEKHSEATTLKLPPNINMWDYGLHQLNWAEVLLPRGSEMKFTECICNSNFKEAYRQPSGSFPRQTHVPFSWNYNTLGVQLLGMPSSKN